MPSRWWPLFFSVVAVFCLKPSELSKVEVVSSYVSNSVPEGQNVQLVCSVEGGLSSLVFLGWKKNGYFLRNTTGVVVKNHLYFNITKMGAKDEGNYTCVIADLDGNGTLQYAQGSAYIHCSATLISRTNDMKNVTQNAKVHVNVSFTAPSVKTANVSVEVQSDVKIFSMQNNSAPHILTYHVPKYITQDALDTFNVSFTVSSIKVANVSLIRRENRTSIKQNISLRQQRHHRDMHRSLVAVKNTASESTDCPMSCTVYTLSWYTASFPSTDSCTRFAAINGNYTFLVKGPDGNDEEDFQVDLQYPATWRGHQDTGHLVQAHVGNQSVRLTCSVCSNPPAHINWEFPGHTRREDVIISASDHTLTIVKVKEQHFGLYRCRARSRVGGETVEKVFDITLEDKGSLTSLVNESTSSRTLVYAVFGGAVMAIIIILVGLSICSHRRRRKRRSNMWNEVKSRNEMSIFNKDMKEDYEKTLLSANSVEEPRYSKPLVSGHFTNPRTNRAFRKVPPPVPDGGQEMKEKKDKIPDYENIDNLQVSMQYSGKESVRRKPVTNGDIDYCELDLIGEGGSQDSEGRLIIHGRDSSVDYADIIHDVPDPRVKELKTGTEPHTTAETGDTQNTSGIAVL